MKFRLFSTLLLGIILLGSTGCGRRSSDEIWDDCRTSSRYMGQGLRKMGGKHGDSRQIRSKEAFNSYSYRDSFVPLQDEEGRDMVSMTTMQTGPSPGDFGSRVPGIEAFSDPEQDSRLKNVFKPIRFGYDSDRVEGTDNLYKVQVIADYMKSHPGTYAFVEGHCDERGPQSYNLALGTRRANSIRSLLIAEGVSPERLYTISYGKERPASLGHTEADWATNRRGQFKTYEE